MQIVMMGLVEHIGLILRLSTNKYLYHSIIDVGFYAWRHFFINT